jgi:hypothetical protein
MDMKTDHFTKEDWGRCRVCVTETDHLLHILSHNGRGSRKRAKKRLIDMIQNDECDFHWDPPDVWLNSGEYICAYPAFDADAKQKAKKNFIDRIQNDDCDFDWEPDDEGTL